MKLIITLGNIGEKYLFTRHNVGFMVADYWALKESFSFKLEQKFKSFISKFRFNNEDFLIIKPTTFMNLSGEAVSLVMNYYKIGIEDIIVIYDDLSLDLGKIRFRANGSDGGHNGVKSIIKFLGSNKFHRLKIGIGPQPQIPSEAFVLQNFPKEQEAVLKTTLKFVLDALKEYLTNGLEEAQNKFN